MRRFVHPDGLKLPVKRIGLHKEVDPSSNTCPSLRSGRASDAGLLKVEQMHALARDVFYGNRGRINARDLWQQMNSCSCLTLIVAFDAVGEGRFSAVALEMDPAARIFTTLPVFPVPEMPDRE